LQQASQEQLISHLDRHLNQLPKPTIGYAIGNIINLLRAKGVDLRQFDFTHRYIAEVDFQDAILHNVDFSHVTCDRCRFAQTLGMPIRILFSPDGRWLAVGDTNCQIKLWEVSTMQEMATLTGHRGWVRDVSFSADSQLLASGSSDGTIRIWDIASQTCLQVIEGHRDWVWRVQFATRKSLVVSFGVDRQCKVWYWKLSKAVLTFTIKDKGLRNVMFEPQHGIVAACSIEGIKLWSIWRLQYLRSITAYATHLRRVVFSPDGNWLVGADLNCQIHCWEVATGQLIHTLTGHTSQISEVNFSESGEIVSTCLDQIRLWHPETGTCLRTIALNQAGSRVADYRPPTLQHPELLATGNDNGVIKLWNISTGECMMNALGKSAKMLTLAVHPTIAHQVATGDSNGNIYVWNFATSTEPPSILQGHQGLILSLAYSPSGRWLASGSHDRTIKIWDTITGQCVQTLEGHTDHIAQLAFLTEQSLLSGSYDLTLREWNLAANKSQILPCNDADFILGMALTPDRQRLAIATPKEYLEIWQCSTPHRLTPHRSTPQPERRHFVGNRLHYLVFQPDHALVGVTDDGILNQWNSAGELMGHWSVTSQEIRAIALHPENSDQLWLTGDDGHIYQWDLAQQCCRYQTGTPHSGGWGIGVMPSGIAVSCHDDGAVRTWMTERNTLTLRQQFNLTQPYQGLNMTGIRGLNRSEISTLLSMGGTTQPEQSRKSGGP
jgi:WD40 repeat protein